MNQSSNIDYEEVWKGGWNDTTRFGPACRHRRRIVADLVKSVPHGTIMDLGCGDGALLSELVPQFGNSRLFGSDVSAEAVELARRAVPGASFEVLKLGTEFSFSGKYDVIVMSEVLEHIEDDESVMRKVAPHCRHIVISVPGGPKDKVDHQYGHFRNYYDNTLPEKLQRNGYDVVTFKRWGWPFYELMLWASHFSSNPAEMSGGKFSPLKKLFAKLGYGLFALNLFRGTQVFAVGRSREFKETA